MHTQLLCLFYVCHDLYYYLICLCYILSLDCDLLFSHQIFWEFCFVLFLGCFFFFFKLRNNSGFFQAFLGEAFFLKKSQTTKSPVSLSCSLPEFQTSSQNTTSHLIYSASVSALGQEISEPFQLYKNLYNWSEKPPKIMRSNFKSLRLKLVQLFPS